MGDRDSYAPSDQDETDANSDWLEASDEEQNAQQEVRGSPGESQTTRLTSKTASHHDRGMGERDIDKVERKLYDEGYREGITVGKEALIQPSFDNGFASTGAPAGRALGQLRGSLHALASFIAQRQALQAKMREQGAADSEVSEDGDVESLAREIVSLQQEASRLRIDDIIEQDWEALEHEREHSDATGSASRSNAVPRETPEARKLREQRIPMLQGRVDILVAQMLKD